VAQFLHLRCAAMRIISIEDVQPYLQFFHKAPAACINRLLVNLCCTVLFKQYSAKNVRTGVEHSIYKQGTFV